MKVLEKILALSVVVSLTLKFALIPGGDTLVFVALTTLACIYFPLGFFLFNHIRIRRIAKEDQFKNLSPQKIIFAVIAGMGLSVICTGMVFKFLRLIGANEMLVIGTAITFVVFIIALIGTLKTQDTYSKFILTRAAIIGSFGIILLVLSPLSIVKLQYRNYPAYVKAYENYLSDPGNVEFQRTEQMEYYRTLLNETEFNRYQKSQRN
jgi:hypothetical protein